MSKEDHTRSYDDKPQAVGLANTLPGTDTAGERTASRGDSFGRYSIRELLGTGGMGEVFAAHDPMLDRLVALKMLKPEVAGASYDARARFEREAQAMARLNHPNVVSVFDVGDVGGRVFVAMELVAGPTLARWLAERRRGWREVVRVFLEAGRGLEAAHAVGIVHRDFKPSNVILGDRVRVADFGLARAAGSPAVPRTAPSRESLLDLDVTLSGALLGTPAYMAPEQLAGAPPSPASDQYSYCVALHEALFGVRPGEAAPKSDVPGWLRGLVRRGLEQDPKARFPSMRALLAELGRERKRRLRATLLATLAAAAVGALVFWAARTPVAKPGPDLTPSIVTREAADSPILGIAISRDGAVLAQLTQNGIVVEPRQGGARTTILPPAELGRLLSAHLSPKGDEIFAAFETPGGRQIWALDVDGGGRQKRIPPAGEAGYPFTSWDVGPDGSLYLIPGIDDEPHGRLLRVDPSGATETLLATDGELIEPVVSPDGARVAIVELRAGANYVNVIDIARRTTAVVSRRGCFPVDWFGPRALACAVKRGGATAVLELALPDGPGEAPARERYVSPPFTAVVGVRGTASGVFMRSRSLEQRIGTVDLEGRGGLALLSIGSVSDVAPAGWTPSGSLIFGANQHGRLQIMALRRDGRIEVVRAGPAAEVPLAVLGETVIFGRFPGGEETIPRGDVTYGRVYPDAGELFRLDADGHVAPLGPTHGFVSLRCAGDRAPPCLLMERTGQDAAAVRWDPESGARGRQVARWSLDKESFHALAPDGRTLAHVAFGGGPGSGSTIELVDLESAEVKRFQLPHPFRHLGWDAQGTLLGIRSSLPMGVCRIRGESVEELWSAPGGGWAFEPRVSLDGKTLAIAYAAVAATYSWAPLPP